MTVYLGVDLHTRSQTVCWCDTTDGEIHQRTLDHRSEDVQFPAPAVVGVEATGYARWFHRLVEETGHRLLVGDARRIRQFAERRQKNDRRDAELRLEARAWKLLAGATVGDSSRGWKLKARGWR